MGKEILSYDDLLQIVELIKSAESFSEFHLKVGEIELDLRKSGAGANAATVPVAPPMATIAPSTTPALAPATAASVPATPKGAPRAAAIDFPAGSTVVRSPMVGTFYRSPEPGAKPFVEVGQKVEADAIVCIIEVMKLMNSMPAGCAGRVTHILVGDAEPVDVGQALIVIDPKG